MMLDDQSPQRVTKMLPGGEPSEERQWLDVISDLYYNPNGETAFGPYGKHLHAAKKLPGAEPSDVKPWLEQQDAHTLHRPVRKRFPRYPNSVSYILDA